MVFKVSWYITDLLLGERSEFSGKSGIYYIFPKDYYAKNFAVRSILNNAALPIIE